MRTGAGKLTEVAAPLATKLVARVVDGDHEILLVEVTADGDPGGSHVDLSRSAGASAHAFAFFAKPDYDHPPLLFIRRAASEAGKPLSGDLYIKMSDASGGGQKLHFEVAASTAAVDPKARTRFFKAAGEYFDRHTNAGPFYAYAHARMEAMNALQSTSSDGGGNARPRRASQSDVARLMETTTGAASIQEALQSDRPLWSFTKGAKGTVPIASLKGPKLADHPFLAMLKALNPKTQPVEALAADAPADFYFLRFTDLSVLFRLIDAADAWGTPIANVLDSRAEDHRLAERYLTQLGLVRSALARSLGTTVIGDLAVVGSDPYLREGTDVTFLFRVKSKALFDGALASALSSYTAAHGALAASDHVVDGVTVHSQHSADGAVTQERASLGDVELVSNSAGAIARVIAAANGKAPRLGDEPDFRYMLARDAGVPADGFGFMGDRFVASVVGARQKVLEARRQLALAALSRPGYAALLFGWFEGRSAANVKELVQSGWLDATDLATPDGAAITFDVGQPVRSRWGSPLGLTPLIDLPTPATVTADEKAGYDSFVSSYENYWRYYMDPIALRIALTPAPGGNTKMSLDLRVLPLIDGSEYRDVLRTAGDARVAVPELPRGVRWVLGVGKDARLREELSGLMGNVMGNKVAFDWLGDWSTVGVEDRTPLAVAAKSWFHGAIETGGGGHSRSENYEDFVRVPFFVGIGIRSSAGAAFFLTGARKLLLDAAPGIVTWEPYSVHKNAHIVRIGVDEKDGKIPNFNLYYALTNGAFYASFSLDTLNRLIDAPAITTVPTGSQLTVDAATQKGAALYTIASWALETAVLESTSGVWDVAEELFRGAPEATTDPAGLSRLAQAYEGAVPVSADGGTLSYGADGVRDSIRGTPFAWRWPALPVANSPVARFLAAVSRFRGEVAFDQEVDVPATKPDAKASGDGDGDGDGAGKPAHMRSLHGRASFLVH